MLNKRKAAVFMYPHLIPIAMDSDQIFPLPFSLYCRTHREKNQFNRTFPILNIVPIWTRRTQSVWWNEISIYISNEIIDKVRVPLNVGKEKFNCATVAHWKLGDRQNAFRGNSLPKKNQSIYIFAYFGAEKTFSQFDSQSINFFLSFSGSC